MLLRVRWKDNEGAINFLVEQFEGEFNQTAERLFRAAANRADCCQCPEQMEDF